MAKPAPKGAADKKAGAAAGPKKPQAAKGKPQAPKPAKELLKGTKNAGVHKKQQAKPAKAALRLEKQQESQEGTTSEKPASTKHEKKEKIRQKKAALKKNFSIIQDAVPLWEVLRRHQTPKEEKERLVDQVLSKVQGKMLELARHHTASRILQFCVMYGTDAQKKLLTDHIKADFLELSKSKHGRHLVQKLIAQAKKEEVPGLAALCKGHVVELLRHPQGADVMIDLYDVANTQLRNAMCAEFYGREFSLFDGITAKGSHLTSLSQLLEGCDNIKRRAILSHMTKALMPIVEKGILHPPMVHRLLKDFFDCAPSASVEDVIDTLSTSGATVLKMVHTHEGAAVGCMLLTYGSAKDRKRLVKAMKGHVGTMATNEWGFTLLCTALSVVDDTSLLSKIIISELKAMLEDAIEDPHASKVLLQLLCPDSKRYLPPAVLEMLHPPQRTVVGTSGNMVTDIEGDEDELEGSVAQGFGTAAEDDDDGDDLLQLKQPKGGKGKDQGNGKKGGGSKEKNGKGGKQDGKGQEGEDEDGDKKEPLAPGAKRVLGLSKKDPLLRRKELLGPANNGGSLASLLCSTCSSRAGSYLRSSVAADVVVEVARGGAQGIMSELAIAGVKSVQSAIVAEVRGTSSEGSTQQSRGSQGDEEESEGGEGQEGVQGPVGPQSEHVCTHYYASRAIRRLLLAGSEAGPGGQCARELAQSIWQGALKGACQRWVGTHAEKILAALLHCGCDNVAREASAELAPLVKPDSPDAWAERLVHTALVKEKQMGAKVGGTSKEGKKGKQQQQQGASSQVGDGGSSEPGVSGQQQQQQQATPGSKKGKQGAAGQANGGPESKGAQQQQQQQKGEQTPAGSVKKRKAKGEEATPGAQKAEASQGGKSTGKKKKGNA